MSPSVVAVRRMFPLLGVLASSVLLVLAAASYPGGYDWFDQSVSSLVQPSAVNGSQNAARTLRSW